MALSGIFQNGSQTAVTFTSPPTRYSEGVAVALEVDLALFFFGASATGSGSFVEFVVVMNDDSVVACGDAGVLDLLAVLEPWGGEFDVIGLPSEGREAHIQVWCLLAVEGSAKIELPLDAE